MLSVCLLALASSTIAAYHHRQRTASVILDNVLYIDGGEIINWSKYGTGFVSNGSDLGDFRFLPENYTYSIDLSVAWTNSSVTLNPIYKTAPVQVSQALWVDEERHRLYAYDGAASYMLHDYVTHVKPEIVPNQLWEFRPDGLSGSWEQVQLLGNATDLVRLQEPTYASGRGLGFALGGLQAGGTDKEIDLWHRDTAAVHGLVVYNMTSDTWQNVSAGYDYARGSVIGAGVFVPYFGPTGVFMAFGGITDQQAQIPLDNAFIYEPVSQKWAIQAVTGDRPPGSNAPCVVGAAGDNGTYEIFLYGGMQPAVNGYRVCDGSVYVLSLPAFHWTKVPSTVYGRYRHTCNAIGRQMISTAGIVFPGPISNDTDILNGGPDPWPNGLGVFDMTDLVWRTSYQPGLPWYRTPRRIKDYYDANELPSWTTDDVKQWFVTQSNLTVYKYNPNPFNNVEEHGEFSTGAIIATVVIGTAVIGLFWWICCLCCQRRKKRRQHPEAGLPQETILRKDAGIVGVTELCSPAGSPEIGRSPVELSPVETCEAANTYRSEMEGQSGVTEVEGLPRPVQADGFAIYELDEQRKV